VNRGAEKLLEADFTDNVDKLKPVVEYKDGTLTVREAATERGTGLARRGGLPQ